MPFWSPRLILRTVGALALLLAGAPAAAWSPDGVLLSNSCCARSAQVVPDGLGGAIIVWQDTRHVNQDIYAQRVTATGEIAPGWPADGVPVCTHPAAQLLTSVAGDGEGGVLITWYDGRNVLSGTTGVDLYAQRLLADGSRAPGWVVDGVPVAQPPGTQDRPVVAADGEGGAYITWHDDATLDISVQHLTADGQVAAGWPEHGLPLCTLPSWQGYPLVIGDGSGGAIVAWLDLRHGGTPTDGPFATYAMRVLADGSRAPGWAEDGSRIVADRQMVRLIPDGAGGGYLACGTVGDFQFADYYLQRFSGAGSIAAGWPEGGVLVCQAPDDRAGLHLVPDGAGGVLLAWYDYRDLFDDEIFLQRVRSDGTLPPGWPENGLRVTDNTGFDALTSLAPDGLGGAYLGWVRGVCNQCQSIVQHVTGAPSVAPGWPAVGLAVPGPLRTGEPTMTADGRGGAIVVWEDSTRRLRALLYVADGPVPVLLSLVRAEAEWDRVRLVWEGAEAGFTAWIERRTSGAEWERLASVSADGSGRIAYEDRAVVAGTRYAYRLAYHEGGELAHTPETWVGVAAPRFHLHGAQPNPVVGDLVVGFSLVSGEPARLELYDLAGRRVLAREVGTPGPGTHRFLLARGARLPAGLYTLVLSQGAARATARAVVLR